MNPSDPQFIYMALVLPGVFGLTMVGEGVAKVMRSDLTGWTVMIGGLLFMGCVALGYLYLVGL